MSKGFLRKLMVNNSVLHSPKGMKSGEKGTEKLGKSGFFDSEEVVNKLCVRIYPLRRRMSDPLAENSGHEEDQI